MRYWDASALVPLMVSESESDRVRNLLREDSRIVTWAWSAVELAGAVERRFWEGGLSRQERRNCLDAFAALAKQWDEVADLFATRTRALPLLARHSIRAADAAQLGAALLVTEDNPAELEFVCLDQRLALAAEKDGLRVLP